MRIDTVCVVIAIVLYIIALLASIVILFSFYICDQGQCKNIRQSGDDSVYLLTLLGSDGIWALPFIGASLIALFSMLFLKIFTPRAFVILLLLSFLVCYCIFSFFVHHYIKPVVDYAIDHLPVCTVVNNDVDDNAILI